MGIDKVSSALVNHSSVRDRMACGQETDRWYQSASGRNAARGTQSAVEEMSGDVFGYYALQVGALAGQYTLLQESRISSCFSIAPSMSSADNVGLVADAAALPIEFDNIDLVVASHVLDCTTSPHQVLREIERVLVPEGHCILIGYNPFSWRGMALFWKRLRKQDAVPSSFTSFRLHDWFTVLGFEVLEIRTTGFRSGLSKHSLFHRVGFLAKMIARYRHLFGNVRLIHVRKKVSKQIPVKPSLRTKPLLKPGMAVNSSGVGKTMNKTIHKTIRQLQQQENGK